MATFGKTDAGISSSTSSANKTMVSPATPASSGTITGATARMSIDSGSATVKFCIYADSAGDPGAKLAESDPLVISNTTEQALNFTFSGANLINVVSGTPYHIGPSWADPGTPIITVYRDSTAGQRKENSSYAADPFGTPTALAGPIAAYVTYSVPVTAEADPMFFDFFTGFEPIVEEGPAPATMVDATNQSFTDSRGLAGQYHVWGAGLPGNNAGLVVHFHGDGAYEHLNPTDNYCFAGNRGIRAVAKAKGYVVVSAKAPDTTGTVTWWEGGVNNADYFAELLTYLCNEYNIDFSKIWLSGYSGGAQFITQLFLPKYSSRFSGGGALILGGGGTPEVTWVAPSAPFKAAFPMHWVTGGQDDGTYADDGFNALADANAGKAYYAGQGFTTTQKTPPGIGHEIDGAFGPMLDDVLPALSGYTPPSRTPGTVRPTLVTSYKVTGTGTGTTTTPSFTPSPGEVIVVKAWNSDLDSPNIGGVTGGGLTFATKTHIQATGKAECWQFVGEVGPVSPGSMNVSVSWFGTTGQHGIIVERWSSGLVKGVPAQSSPVMGSGAPSGSITPENANSVITWLDTDWDVVTGTAAYRSSAVETQQSSTSNMRAYAAYQNSTGTGAQTVGLTAPTGQEWAMGAIELLPAP